MERLRPPSRPPPRVPAGHTRPADDHVTMSPPGQGVPATEELTMQIKGSVALVTGANRGIGRAFARSLINHGAAKVYAGVRDPASVTDADLVPLRLDVTDHAQVTAAAALADDVTIV